MEILEIDNKYVLLIDKGIYSLNVLHKCFYWYTGDFNVELTAKEENYIEVVLKPLNEIVDFEDLKRKIQRDLIDFNLRDIITRETQTIRELIVAKAFANYEDTNEIPQGDISDPVGFDPQLIQ